MGHVERPQSEPPNDDTQFSRSRMASAPDCTRAWDQPRDRWPRAGEQVNSTITTHVLLAVVRRDDQRLESQLRQSRGARYRERMGYDDAAQNSIVGRSMGISANGPQLSALGKDHGNRRSL
jgi:hypothetical protein